MAFRIKNTYQFNCKKDYDGHYITELPQLVFVRSDDNNDSIQSVLDRNQEQLYIKAERLCFNKIFNIDNQNIYIYEINDEDVHNISWTLKMTKSLRRGQKNVTELKDFFTLFNEARLKFSFEQDKTKVSGKLTIENNNIKVFKIKLKKKMAMILGLLNDMHLRDNSNSYIEIQLPGKDETINGDNILTSKFDILNSIKDIKLYSQFVFNYPTEIWQKHLSRNELLNDNECKTKLCFELKHISLNSKQFRADRFNPKECKFYFLDFFNDHVCFDFVELTIFLSNK